MSSKWQSVKARIKTIVSSKDKDENQKSNEYPNTIYLIRHGEKPLDGAVGLTATGEERAKGLVKVFGPESEYNIGYIMAIKVKPDGRHNRPLQTVTPLAEALNIKVDTTNKKTESKGVAKSVRKYVKQHHKKNVLICWEHHELTNIAKELGVKDAPKYPSERFDLIWAIKNGEFLAQASEHIPGLDDAHAVEPSPNIPLDPTSSEVKKDSGAGDGAGTDATPGTGPAPQPTDAGTATGESSAPKDDKSGAGETAKTTDGVDTIGTQLVQA